MWQCGGSHQKGPAMDTDIEILWVGSVFECPYCDHSYATSEGRNAHLRKCHHKEILDDHLDYQNRRKFKTVKVQGTSTEARKRGQVEKKFRQEMKEEVRKDFVEAAEKKLRDVFLKVIEGKVGENSTQQTKEKELTVEACESDKTGENHGQGKEVKVGDIFMQEVKGNGGRENFVLGTEEKVGEIYIQAVMGDREEENSEISLEQKVGEIYIQVPHKETGEILKPGGEMETTKTNSNQGNQEKAGENYFHAIYLEKARTMSPPHSNKRKKRGKRDEKTGKEKLGANSTREAERKKISVTIAEKSKEEKADRKSEEGKVEGKSEEEKAESKTKEEKVEIKLNEDKIEVKSKEKKAERKSKEEKAERKSKEEEVEIKSKEEIVKRKSKGKKAEQKSKEEKAERKSKEETPEKNSKEETPEKKSKEENTERKSREEKAGRKSKKDKIGRKSKVNKTEGKSNIEKASKNRVSQFVMKENMNYENNLEKVEENPRRNPGRYWMRTRKAKEKAGEISGSEDDEIDDGGEIPHLLGEEEDRQSVVPDQIAADSWVVPIAALLAIGSESTMEIDGNDQMRESPRIIPSTACIDEEPFFEMPVLEKIKIENVEEIEENFHPILKLNWCHFADRTKFGRSLTIDKAKADNGPEKLDSTWTLDSNNGKEETSCNNGETISQDMKSNYSRGKFKSRAHKCRCHQEGEISREISPQRECISPWKCEGAFFPNQNTGKNGPGEIPKTEICKKIGQIECRFCDYAHSSRTAIQVHERIHTGERPYECPYCPKTFRNCTNWDDHKRRHLAICPYVCSICGIAFVVKRTRKLHERCHEAGALSCKCIFCRKYFISNQELRSHCRQMHTKTRGKLVILPRKKCKSCPLAYQEDATLAEHYNKIHGLPVVVLERIILHGRAQINVGRNGGL